MTPTRRAALGLLAAGAALPLARAVPALAQAGRAGALPAGLRLRAVAVDAARLARLGNPGGAELVTRDLTRNLRAVFADLIVPGDAGGATLVARISSLYLTSYAGTKDYGGRNSSGSGNDNLEGVGTVVSGGRVVAEVPILSVLSPGYSGAWYQPDIDERRVDAICHHFAWWLRREMGV